MAMTPGERERRRLLREAEQRQRIQEYGRQLAAGAPPLTPEGIETVRALGNWWRRNRQERTDGRSAVSNQE